MEITKFYLEKWYVEYEFKSKYNLSASGIKTLKFNEIEHSDDFYQTNLTYSPANGSDDLLTILAKNNNTEKNNLLVTNGAIEGLFLIQMLLFKPSDNIIVVRPVYPALYQIAEDMGSNIIDWSLNFNDNFQPDLNNLEQLMEKHQPKALIINFPNNPTGAKLNFEQKQKIIDLCKKYNSYLISDEVYGQIDLDNDQDFPEYHKKITINSLSKSYGLPGLRIGWVKAEPQIIEGLINIRHYTTLCNNVLSEKIAYDVLSDHKKYIKRSLDILKKNSQITYNVLDKLKEAGKIDYIRPAAGLMIFIKLLNVQDSEVFCRKFEDKTGILLLPGNKYGDDYKEYFRLGFGIDLNNLTYCLDKFSEFILSW